MSKKEFTEEQIYHFEKRFKKDQEEIKNDLCGYIRKLLVPELYAKEEEERKKLLAEKQKKKFQENKIKRKKEKLERTKQLLEKMLINMIEKKNRNEKVNEMLNDNFKKRKNTLEKYLPFLNTTLRKGKGINSRKRFLHFIKFGANTKFDNEEEEYNFIGKFGRGLWSEEFICKKAFYTKEEEDTIVELAKEYGAFDY